MELPIPDGSILTYHGVNLIHGKTEVGSLESDSLHRLEDGVVVHAVSEIISTNGSCRVEIEGLSGGKDDTLDGLERGGEVRHGVDSKVVRAGLKKMKGMREPKAQVPGN